MKDRYTKHPRIVVGDVFPTKHSGDCEVIHVDGTGSVSSQVTVKFFNTGTVKTFRASELRRGHARDPYAPTVFGVGYLGEGKYKGNHVADAYNTWYAMLTRVYADDPRYHTYTDCSVDPRWHNFQVFAAWYYANYQEGYHLDKDVLGTSRTYGPDTCVYIPKSLNGIEARLRQALTECPELQPVYDLFIVKVKERIKDSELLANS